MFKWSRQIWLVLLGAPIALSGQARQISAPAQNNTLLELTQEAARASTIGDLQLRSVTPGDVEVRFWLGYGLSGTNGLILRRSGGRWLAWQARLQDCLWLMPASARDPLSPEETARYKQQARDHCDTARDTIPGRLMMADRVTLTPFVPSPSLDLTKLWDEMIGAGLAALPPDIPTPPAAQIDGMALVIEVRRNDEYRATIMQCMDQPRSLAVHQVAGIVDLLGREFPALPRRFGCP